MKSAHDLSPTPHAVVSASADANNVSVSDLSEGSELFANCSSPITFVNIVASHHYFDLQDTVSLLAHGKQLDVA